MAALKALELDGHLDEVAQAPVCALVGDAEALQARSLRTVRDAAAPPDQPGSTVREFDGAVQARDVFDELRTIPFLGLAGRRAVVINDGDEFLRAHGEKLVRYLKTPSPTSTLILCLSKLDGRSAPAKAISAKGIVVDCTRLTWGDAETWARAHARTMGLRFTPRAARTLIEATGPNVLALETEIEKLAAYCGSEGTVSERDVGEVVAAGRGRSVFDLSNAVSRGDAAEALRLCNRLLLRGERREAIIAHLGRQVRRLWQVKRLKAAGASEQDVARGLGMPPFAVRQSLASLRGLTDDWFVRQLRILSAADMESKVTSVRSGEAGPWLENLLMRLCER
jgi:DNA polymerase-3 subunit delta